jgi:hypothetical protein
MILLISASRIARIIGVIHWHPAVLGVFKIGSHELFGWFRTVIS